MIWIEINKAVLRTVVISSVILVGACRRDLCPEAARVDRDYQGECLGRVDYPSHTRVEISPAPGCPWERLVDLGIFEGFRPGMDIKEAERLLGRPDIEKAQSSPPFWRYSRPGGVVQIAHEDQGSAIIPMYRWWVLRAYPKDTSPQALFPPEVVERLPSGTERYEVVVLNQCRLPMAEVFLENGKVQLMTWIDNPGSYNPRDEGV